MKLLSSYWWVAAIPAIFCACDPEIPQDPAPTGDRVVAVFDVATSTIPLPNTAALEEDGTLPDLGAGTEGAEADFFAWLDGLHGWSESTPITVPFSGDLDPESVTADAVKLWRVEDDGTFTDIAASPVYLENDDEGSLCNPSVCASVILIVPAEPLAFGAKYAGVVTKDVKDASGDAVAESAAIFYAASPEPLYNFETGEVLVSVLEDDPAQAATLEGLRMLLAPVFTAALDAEITRNEVASAFTWTVANDPFTVLDPDTATLPIPNVIALEADGTFPAAALTFCGGPGVDPEVLADDSCGAPAPEWKSCSTSTDCDAFREQGDPAVQCVSGRCVYARCAQGQFDTYLDGLHGWPTTTPITLPVTAPIDEATLSPETVQLWSLAGGVPTMIEGTTVSLTECGDQILITPPAPMDYNTSYIAFATKDVKSTNTSPTGEPLSLTPSAPILLALMPNDPGVEVGDCTPEENGQACAGGGVCGGIPGVGFKCIESTISRVSDDQAAAVMAVRPAFRGAVEAIEATTDLEWDDLAAAWTWTTWTDTFLVFDPTAGSLPFPHTLLTTGCPNDEPICLLPEGEGPTGAILDELRTREGFSSTAPNWVPLLGPPLQADSVSTDSVLFAEADQIPPPLFDAYNVDVMFDHLLISFDRPLKPDILVAGLTTTDLIGGNGFPAQPTPAFVFLRSEFPLVDAEGRSTIREIPDDATAAVLEDARQQFEQLFLVALLFGYGRDEVNNAWAYVTGETYKPLQRLRARTLDKISTDGVPTATANSPDVWNAGDGPISDPDAVTQTVDVSNIETIHWNVEFDTFDWVGSDLRIVDAANVGREAVGVTVFIPRDPLPLVPGGCEPPYDVAIAQHGNGGFRKVMGLAVANELAGACIATIAMDLPLHGGRIPGSPMLHPDSTPANSGDGFISGDFPATVAWFQQATLDLVVLTQMIKNGAFDSVAGGLLTDNSSEVGYVGQSLGSFIGSLYLTIDPVPTGGVINVGGGNFATVLSESAAFSPLLEAAGLMPDTFEQFQALHFIQWLGEWIDPYAFAPYPVLNPLTELTWDGTDFVSAAAPMEPKDMLIQMAEGDAVVPNASTELLARTMGVSLDDTTYPAGTSHGFLTDLDVTSMNAEEAHCARLQIAAWLSTSFAGDAMLTANQAAAACIAAQ